MSLRYKAGFITESYDPLLVPDAPTIGTATAASGTSASITFTAPSNIGGGAITGYIATAYDSSGNAISATGSASPITVTGLTTGTPYTIKVAATNAYGTGAYSAASNSVTPPFTYIEDVFSTYLYTGNGSTQTITNNIDLSGKGGLLWTKRRSTAYDHYLFDTARGASNDLKSNSNSAQNGSSPALIGFNTNGFSLTSSVNVNQNTGTYASWTFRKQPKFFDIVTYTGNGVAGRTISHNLGSVPGCIIVKNLTTGGTAWEVYHRSLGNTKIIELNSNAAAQVQNEWNNTDPTSTVFSVYSGYGTNFNGDQYVAYLFAHDAGGFGNTGNDNVISCGSFTTDGSGNATVNLGYEPQWIMLKKSSAGAEDWYMFDSMRGIATGGADAQLNPNLSAAEASTFNYINLTATGFDANNQSSSATYIYIAIRRGPMKTPTVGTDVFKPTAFSGNGGANSYSNGFPTDLVIHNTRNTAGLDHFVYDRLRGRSPVLYTNLTNAESGAAFYNFNAQNNLTFSGSASGFNAIGETYIDYNFQRAPSFFDVVCVTGTGAGATYNHNLGVTPELMIQHGRSLATDWETFTPLGKDYAGPWLNKTNGASVNSNYWTAPTSTTFKLQSSIDINGSTYVAYLFASCPGVSKVGSYTGTGTTQTINCGFTTGARFVMIKRTDSTGDWYVWDSARGIVAGNDPYLLINSTAAEVTNTDYVDASAAGFEISSTAPAAINANGGTFIYLAIA